MKVAIISDIHDNLNALKNCLEICKDKKVEKILCLGDVTNKETVLYLTNHFSNDIFLVRGNACNFDENFVKKITNIKYFSKSGIIKIDNLNIGLVHEPFKIKELKENDTNFDFIFYGHTHKPWIEKENNYYLVNPGNLIGDFYPSSFAILNTDNKKIELILNN